MSGDRNILALNSGSSSLKFGIYRCGAKLPELLAEGEAEEIGRETASFSFRKKGEEKRSQERKIPDQPTALALSLDALKSTGLAIPNAVGHRFVHGGAVLREHSKLTQDVYDKLRKAAQFAPLHVPLALAVLDAVREKMPDTPQVVCLDTAFHRTMPEVARTFALPVGIRQMGVERYGFHGISLESILAQLDPVPDRLVVAHLGNGCSITAIHRGVSIDTSMGLTPTGGFMMGTRPGDLDPGIVIFLVRNGYGDASNLEQMLDHECGLKGVSEKSSDVRDLTRDRAEDHNSDLALRMFTYQATKTIAAMASALGGMDHLVFTGGIGEHAGEIRDEICSGLTFMGKCTVQVLPSEENRQIARITASLAAS